MPNLYPPKEKNAHGTDSAPIFGDVNQSEKLSETKLPLVLRLFDLKRELLRNT